MCWTKLACVKLQPTYENVFFLICVGTYKKLFSWFQIYLKFRWSSTKFLVNDFL